MEKYEIKEMLREVLLEIQSNEPEITFKEYVEGFYLPYYRTKERKRLKNDLKCFGVILSYGDFSSKKIVDINKNDIQQLLYNIKNDRSISWTTVNRYRSKLLAIFYHAVNEGIVQNNPVKAIKKHKEQYRSRYLTAEEAQSFLEACRQSRNTELYDIVLIALYTGMRESEILGLTKDNIAGDYIKLKDKQTKSDQARVIPIHLQILPIIGRRVAMTADERLFMSKSIRAAKENAIKRAGLEEFKFHDVRRTCATWLKDNDTNLHTISKILGHSSVTMTERYLASNPKQMKEAIETLPVLE